MQESANHTELTAQVQRLEDESRQLLKALKWSTRVRNMTLVALIAFAAGAGAMFYNLFQEIKNNRLAEVQQLFIERQDEFLGPLTQAAMDLAEETGPEVLASFRNQLSEDSSRYLEVIGQERTAIAHSLKTHLEQHVSQLHVQFLEENEALLAEQFPELKDPQSREIFHRNLEAAFQEIGQRYYVKYFDAEYEKLVENLERFPAIRPTNADTPVAKQLAAETAKLFQMLAANAGGTSLDNNPNVLAGLLSPNEKHDSTEHALALNHHSNEQAQGATAELPSPTTNLITTEDKD